MKKAIYIFLALIMCISLCACGEKAEVIGPSNETAIATEPVEDEETLPPEPPASVLFDSDKMTYDDLDEMVVDQGNRHSMSSFCFDSSWIYGAWAGEQHKGEVVKVRYDNSDWTVIDSDTNGGMAYCQAIKNGYLYYAQRTDEGYELIKVRSSGDDPKVIVANHHGFIQVVDNYIYYTTAEYWNEDYSAVTEESSHLYRCDLNGENVEAILEKPVYYFTVFENNILYQDDKDSVTLHIYDMSSGIDKRINEQRSFSPIFDGNYIYYLSDSTSPEEYQQTLWRVTPDGSANEQIDLGCYTTGLLLRGDYVYYINIDDGFRIYRCLKDGSDIELVTQDSNISTFQWVNNCLAYVTVDQQGYISGIYLCDADGGDKIEFCKSDDYWYLE